MTESNLPPFPEKLGAGEESHLDEDLCICLLHDLLAEEHRNALLAHAARCGACERLFQGIVAERSALRASWSLRWASGVSPGLERSGRSKTDGQARAEAKPDGATGGEGSGPLGGPVALLWLRARALSLRWYAMAAVATAAVAVLAVMLFPHGTAPGADPPLLPPYPQVILQRGQGNAPPALRSGLDAYVEHDFARAIRLLRAADLDGAEGRVRDVYLASALTRERRYKEALDVFARVSGEGLPEPWESGLYWTRYSALRGDGRRAEADSVLRRLARLPGETGQRAQELLRRSER